ELVRRREHSDPSAICEMRRGPPQLFCIIGNVLEHIDVKNRVKPLIGREPAGGAHDDAAFGRKLMPIDALFDARRHVGGGLQANPLYDVWRVDSSYVGPDAGTDVEDASAEMRLHQGPEITFPVDRPREKLELRTLVGETSFGRELHLIDSQFLGWWRRGR